MLPLPPNVYGLFGPLGGRQSTNGVPICQTKYGVEADHQPQYDPRELWIGPFRRSMMAGMGDGMHGLAP